MRRAFVLTEGFLGDPQLRRVRLLNPSGVTGAAHYGAITTKKGGIDHHLRFTEFYDGYTDDFGVFKEGAPSTLRLEYIRSPRHHSTQTVMQRNMWSPFQAPIAYKSYSPLWYDWQGFSSRDRWGHRSGDMPGSRTVMGHYRKAERRLHEQRVMINHHTQRRIPKWLACICHYERQHSFVGFFLYANGVYVAELLTYKQLPRLVYNVPFEGCLPTLGQTVDLGEVTYGKEVHSVERYPGYGGVICRAAGTAAVVLRGTEPNLVPLMLPSKEVRLFDISANAVYGRRAGVMYRHTRISGATQKNQLRPSRPHVRNKAKTVSQHPAGGGNGSSPNLVLSLDWKLHPYKSVKTKYWLSGYILRSRQYQRTHSVADIRSKTYSWASRDKVYRDRKSVV